MKQARREEKPVSLRRLWIAAACMAVLCLAVLTALPRILPYERIEKLYGLMRASDRQPLEALPAGGENTVYLLADGMLNLPETWLVANGSPLLRVTAQQVAGQEPVTLDPALLREPGALRLRLEMRFPLVRLSTNTITVPVEESGVAE